MLTHPVRFSPVPTTRALVLLVAAVGVSPLAAQVVQAHPVIDVRSATVTVAAANSRAARNHSADFTCSGTNDHLVLRAALAALPPGGGSVSLSEGTFTLGDELAFLRDNVRLVGQGRSTILLRPYSATSGAILRVGSATVRPHGIHLGRLSLRRSGAVMPGYAISVDRAADFVMDGCAMEKLYEGTVLSDVDGGCIQNCVARDVGKPFVLVGASDFAVRNNRLERIGVHGIAVSAGGRGAPNLREHGIVVTGNQILDVAEKGIVARCGMPGAELSGVTISANQTIRCKDGIQVGQSTEAVVANNVVLDSIGPGIYVYEADQRALVANNTIRGCADGIVVGNTGAAAARDVELRGNAIEGNNIGITVIHADGLLIAGNRIRNNTKSGTRGYGILVTNNQSRNLTICDNDFSGHAGTQAGFAIILLGVVQGSNPRIRGNVFRGSGHAGEQGISFSRSAEPLFLNGNSFRGYTAHTRAFPAPRPVDDYRQTHSLVGSSWQRF